MATQAEHAALIAEEFSSPERSLQLAVVDFGEDSREKDGKEYPLIKAANASIENTPYPSIKYKRLHIDLLDLYADDLTDVWGRNEGLLKLQVSTKNPQDLSQNIYDATYVVKFLAEDHSYTPSFLHTGTFRNIIIEDWAVVKIELYELDTNATEYYDKIRSVLNKVPEIKSLDVFKGVPYLNLASQLFDGIIRTFGRNPDDYLWGVLPILEFDPTIGGAFLRSGVYVLMEQRNSKKEQINVSDLYYIDGKIKHKQNRSLSSHLLLGIAVKDHNNGG